MSTDDLLLPKSLEALALVVSGSPGFPDTIALDTAGATWVSYDQRRRLSSVQT